MSAVLPGMIANGEGRIINISSLAGTRILPNLSAYAVAKGTLNLLTEHVAAEMRPHGIAVFAIEPGHLRRSGIRPSARAPATAHGSCFLRPIRETQPHPAPRTGELNGMLDMRP